MTTRKTAFAALAVLSVGSALLTGCSASTGSSDDGSVELSVQTFGQFGYEDLYKQYEEENPGVTVTATKVASSTDAAGSINTYLAANNGMPDVVAVESGDLAAMMEFPDKWLPVDASLADRWLPWKSAAATDDDGEVRFYGVDAGPGAICFRSDLLEAAGLPSDPDGFSSWIGDSWDSYYSAGEEYVSKTGKPWFDSAVSVLTAKIAQIPESYEDEDGTVIATTNPDVKEAYESALEGNETLSAKLAPFSTEWNTGFTQDAFATEICPSWMIGVIQAAAPNVTGWNVAGVFPGGTVNRGGSYLGVSTQTKHPEEAQKLAAWLTAPEQGVAAFEAVGSFPSQVEALSSPTLLEATNAYASDAPTGQIYAEAAQEIEKVPYRGPQFGTINTFLQDAITRVETGAAPVDASWDQFVDDVESNTK